jgi:hypothetical protein
MIWFFYHSSVWVTTGVVYYLVLPCCQMRTLSRMSCCFIHFWRIGCEGPIRRTREGGSEWEPIKILLEGDGNSNKMNTASNTCLRFTTQVGQAHVATGVPLDLETNTHTLSTLECSGTPNLESTDQHRSDRWAPPVRPVPAGETGQHSLSDSTPVRPVRHTG